MKLALFVYINFVHHFFSLRQTIAMHAPQYYSDYLGINTILDAQHPVSFNEGNEPAHDEMLFIIIHQAYELWFKQILFEIDSVVEIMKQPSLNDNSPELQTVVHRINRVNQILKVLIHQVDIMETMTPMDFLDFRDLLRPASGFQSWQFKLLEARLGLAFNQRHGQQYYTSALNPTHAALIKNAETDPTLLQLMNNWLERMPFFSNKKLWEDFETNIEGLEDEQIYSNSEKNIFWKTYRELLKNSLATVEASNLQSFDKVMSDSQPEKITTLTPAACRAALFIMLYRGYPVLQLPFQLINAVLETDEHLSTWRYRHMNMVHRMIGHRIGTGGSTGEAYLKGAADKHYIFKDFALLTSFLIERKRLPKLSHEMAHAMGFVG
jgi:tryptophan 2,3-dioxygenase